MLTSKQRAFLRSQAQSLEPIIYLGKEGVGEAFLAAARKALEDKELCKGVALENAPLTAREAADTLAPLLGAETVQVIGRRFVLFLPKADPALRRFDLAEFRVIEPIPEKKAADSRTAAEKPAVKPCYKKAAAMEREKRRKQQEKAAKAAYFREKARQARLSGNSENSENSGNFEKKPNYTIVKGNGPKFKG